MAKGRNGGSRRKDGVWDPLKSSSTDRQRAEAVPKTPQTMSPAYRLAYVDEDFLCREELRPIRLQLELLKTEMMLTERGIRSTVVMSRSISVRIVSSARSTPGRPAAASGKR